MKPIKVLCLVALVVVSSSSLASSQNVQQHELDPIANEEHFTLLGFVVWTDTLEMVRSRLGKAEILVGEGHEPSEVCYVSSEQNDGTTVTFLAGFMGGQKTLTSFILSGTNATRSGLTNKKAVKRQCLPSPIVSRDIGTPSGLRLGLRSSQVKELLGEPTKVDKNVLTYVLVTRMRTTEDDIAQMAQVFPEEQIRKYPYYDVSRFIEVEIADGQVEQVSVTMIENY